MRTFLVRLMRALTPAALGLAAAVLPLRAQAQDDTRSLDFYNIHTKERVSIIYKRDGEFLPEGMERINHIMRDWRRDEATEMDPELIDTIWEIYQDLGSKEPIHLVSGYRSSKTNESMRRRGGGQARFSQHILGKAADIHLPDIDVKQLRNSALVREVGGVGYYPKSGLPFVHVDTGKVRHWPRIPRQELAGIMTQGKQRLAQARQERKVAQARLEKKIDEFIANKSRIELPPRMLMAGFTPRAIWPQADPVTTASLPRETPSPADPARAKAPLPQIAISPLEDAEHPEELNYQLFSMLPLMSDAQVSDDRHLADLTAPGPDEEGYLLREPEGSYSASLARGLGYTQELKLVRFGSADPAVVDPSLRASAERMRTASR